MDTINTIIGLVFLSLILGPIYIINSNVKKTKNQLLNTLNGLSIDHNVKFSETDFWNNASGIGLKGDVIVFFRKTGEIEQHEVIDLKDVKKCSLLQLDKHGNVPKSNHDINKLVLNLVLNDHKEINLVFFQADAKNFVLGEEFRIAKKWQDIITHSM